MPANLENSAVATGLEKVSFIPIPKKYNAKECSNYCTIVLSSHASKVMLKILQARLQQYVNCKLPDVQTGFRHSQPINSSRVDGGLGGSAPSGSRPLRIPAPQAL